MKKIARITLSFLLVIVLGNQLKAQKTTGQQKQVSPKSVSDHITVMKESSTSSAKPYVSPKPIAHTNERSLPPEPTKAYPVYKSRGTKTSGNAN
jgi:hypothetical protein